MMTDFFRTRSWISKVTAGVTIFMLLASMMSPLTVALAQDADPTAPTIEENTTTEALTDLAPSLANETEEPEQGGPSDTTDDTLKTPDAIDEPVDEDNGTTGAEHLSAQSLSFLPSKGSITICKVVLDAQGNVVRGDAGSSFDIGIDFNSPVHFSTPTSWNADLFPGVGDSGGIDAQCSTYENLNLNGAKTTYHYEAETITGGSWEAPLYNDSFYSIPDDLDVNDLGDFKEFGTPDGADGIVSLLKLPVLNNRTVVIINRMKSGKTDDLIQIHGYKHLLGEGNATAQIPNEATDPAFPMIASWQADNLNGGAVMNDNYTLGTYWPGEDHEYGADLKYAYNTFPMQAPADFSTYEVADGNLVLPTDAQCVPGKYRLVGYKTGTSLAAAQAAAITTTAPNFVDVTEDQYFIVVNEKCDGEVVEQPKACDESIELVKNGDFEMPSVPSGSWDLFPSGTEGLSWIVNWLTSVSGQPDPALLEIQNDINGWGGDQHQYAELDGDWSKGGGSTAAQTVISQDIPTVVGQTYVLSFKGRQRPFTEPNDNQVKVTIGADAPETFMLNSLWGAFTKAFTATSTMTTISLADAGVSADSLGTLVDDVSVRCDDGQKEPVETFTIHGYKHLLNQDGSTTQIPDDANEPNFPMIMSWQAPNLNHGAAMSDNYWFGNYWPGETHEYGADLKYAFNTFPMEGPADFSTYEVADGNLVLPTDAQCVPGKYRLVGYKTGTSLAAAQAAAITTTAPNFVEVTSEQYFIVVNEKCPGEIPQGTLKVHIYKYLKNGDTIAQVPDNAPGVPQFPMTASWSASNVGTGAGSYMLGNHQGGAVLQFAADTDPLSIPADYSTIEATNPESDFLSIGSQCVPGKYHLLGYKSGLSLADAEQAPISGFAPDYHGITSDRYVIVVNEKCADDNGGGGEEPTNSEETIVVRAADLADEPSEYPTNWFFYNDEADVINNTLGSFVTGPGVAPLGSGSAQISVTGSERRNLATYQFGGVKLTDIKTLKFNTYNPSAGNSGSGTRSAYLNFNVDFHTGTITGYQNRLVYVPSANGSVTQDNWKEWDAIASGNALYSWSGFAKGPDKTSSTADDNSWPDGNTTPNRTWNDLVTAFPNISLLASNPWMGMRVGEPYADGYTENIDKFVIGIQTGSNIHTKTFDFEPTPTSTDTGGGGGSSSSRRSGGGSSSSLPFGTGGGVLGDFTGPAVLGESVCGEYLTDYIKLGKANDSANVSRLQLFLNEHLGLKLKVDGIFGHNTFGAVKQFQLKHTNEVLKPWVGITLADANNGTGWVYKTTKRWVNMIKCPELNLAMPELTIDPKDL